MSGAWISVSQVPEGRLTLPGYSTQVGKYRRVSVIFSETEKPFIEESVVKQISKKIYRPLKGVIERFYCK
jgi:hypothetical protein